MGRRIFKQPGRVGIFGQAKRKPERMTIVNTDDPRGSRIEAQFNPTQFTEALKVNYSRQQVSGLSHQLLQYEGTSNDAIAFELFFDADGVDRLKRNLFARKFLQSVCYPRRLAQLVTGGGPPRLMFIWPGFIGLTCVLTSLTFTYERFAPSGHPLDFRAAVSLEEIRDFRLLSDDVLGNVTTTSDLGDLGTFRDSGDPGGESV